MDTDPSYLKTALLTVLGGGVLFTAFGALIQTHKEVPGRIVIAAGNTHYFELAESYRADLERNGVRLEVRRKVEVAQRPEAKRANETYDALYALIDPASDVNASFVKGGLYGSLKGSLATSTASPGAARAPSPGNAAPAAGSTPPMDPAKRAEMVKKRRQEFANLTSIGRIMLEPIWVFTRAQDTDLKTLSDLKGKKILTGTLLGGTRRIALQLLRANGVERGNSERIEQELQPDGSQLLKGEADAAILILPPDSETIQSLLRVEGLRLVNFKEEAAAYVNKFPALSKVELHKGAVDLGRAMPSEDTTLLATSAALVVRSDLDPALVSLLTYAAINNPRPGFDRADDPVLFHRAGDFPNDKEPEYEFSKDARLVYKSGELPYLLRTVAPINARMSVPFSITAFANAHWTKLVLLIPLLAIVLPLMRILPILYNWNVRRRLVHWYRKLKAVERSLDRGDGKIELAKLQAEVEQIDDAARRLRVPHYYSDQLYHLRLHIDLVRQRLLAKPAQFRMAAE